MTCGDCKHYVATRGICGNPERHPAYVSAYGTPCRGFEPDSQPAPVPNGLPRVHDLVLADLEGRLAQGLRTYGVPLQPHNGRDALTDAYHECLDMAMYLRQAIYERDGR